MSKSEKTQKSEKDLVAQIEKLDFRLGKGVGATKERAKIELLLKKIKGEN